MLRRAPVGRTLPIVLVLAIVATLLTYAALSTGYPLRKLELNDTGIWVSNDRDSKFGRLNKSASSLDAFVSPPKRTAESLDVLQDGNLVAGHNISNASLFPIDTALGAPLGEREIGISDLSQIDMRGGTLAVMDRTGKVWAERYDPMGDVLDLSQVDQSLPPLATLGLSDDAPPSAASLSVGVDGVVHAAAINGKAVTIPVESGLLGKAVVSDAPSGLRAVEVTAVGATSVVLDSESGSLYLPGRTVQLQDATAAKLQQPGPDAADVLVATKTTLFRVDLKAGTVAPVDTHGDGVPAAPVRLAGCAFAAWQGEGHVIRACDNRDVESQLVQSRDGKIGLEQPTFRTNHGLLLLNDQKDGLIWDLDLQSKVDNWPNVDTLTQQQAQKKRDSDKEHAKPKANPDNESARPKRTTVLHLLDNDTDTAGGILSIVKVNRDGLPKGVNVEVSPDGQAVKFFLPDNVSQAHFTYTVSNGRNKDEGSVDVSRASGNTGPKLRPNYRKPDYTVASSGTLSIPVVQDWRDREGDPVTLLSATDDKGRDVPVSADGRIEFTAARAKADTDATLSYKVTDGVEPLTIATQQLRVRVLGYSSKTSVSAQAQPDIARGEVGKPIAIAPLANDLPGADPRDPQARLTLSGDVANKANIKVTTDVKGGQVVAIPQKEGTYFLDYQVGFGSAKLVPGRIRVDALPKGSGTDPVAMPDQAAIRGQAAVMVDVLANDYDPAGDLLTVQSADPAEPDQLQVAVIAGRWLRIMPLADTLSPNPQAVHYWISNGSQKATGDVLVTQLDPVDQDAALVRADTAVVRDGDAVLIPVLTNDTSLSGGPLRLATNDIDTDNPGELLVSNPAKSADEDQGDVGRAFVHGDQIRYVAPAKVDAPTQVLITYYALTAGGDSARGQVRVTINPQPSADFENRAPAPQPVEIRVVSGSRVSIPIPTSGQDPDGDSVTVTGITTPAPMLGRIVGISPTSLTYEAYPTAGLVGTDTFRYVVSDRYGETGIGSLRVGVVDPGQTQPPVAMDDAVTAQPGAKVQVNVLANDLVSRDDTPTIVPLEDLNKPLPAGVSLGGEKGPIVATAPGADGQPVLINYALTGNGGVGPSATVTIDSKDGYNNPPVVSDQTATIDGKVGKADLLTNAWDVDGDLGDLRVEGLPQIEGLTLNGSALSVPLLDHPQVVPFVVTDAGHAASGGVVYVPAMGVGAPKLKSGASIEIGQNQTSTFALADYVESPAGKVVKISSSKIAASPDDRLQAKVDDPDKFTLTAQDDYVGPGSVTVQVMDAESLTAEGVLQSTITIPVQVGPKTPVLRCPKEAQLIMQGGRPKNLDITTLCHVWSPNPDELGDLTYTANWSKPIDGVTATGGSHTVKLQAAGSAMENTSGSLTVGIAGTQAIAAELNISVQQAPKAKWQIKPFLDIKAGTPVTIPISLVSPLIDSQVAVVSVKQVGGMAATWPPPEGAKLVITPDANSWGTMSFEVTATDLASDPTRESRWVTRKVVLVVYTRPDPPSAPQPGANVLSHAVTLTVHPGKANGAPIDYYELVGSNGKTYRCRSTTCTVKGLPNAIPISFRVRAHNKAGFSDPSPSSPQVTPDTPPQAPPWVKVSNPVDGGVTVSWGATKTDGSRINKFWIRWDGGTPKSVSGSATSATISGLDNNHVYTFTVSAENNDDEGPGTSADGQSSGKPLGLSVKDPDPKSSVGATTQVAVSWTLGSPNGPKPVTYSVTRSDGKKICSGGSSLSCTDDTVKFDGTSYTYTVTATNNTGGAEHSSSDTSPVWKAIGTPDAWGSWSVAPTGSNGTVHLSYTVPHSRGASSTVTLLNNGSAFKSLPSLGADGGADSRDIGGLDNGTSYHFSLKVCNEASRCSTSSEKSVTPFGPLSKPSVSASPDGQNVNISASGNGNGEDATLTVRVNGNVVDSQSGKGSLQISRSVTVGYSQTVTVTATLTTGSTNPSRGDGGEDSTSVRTPDPPKTVSISKSGTLSTDTNCVMHDTANGRCPYVAISTSGFSGNITCTIYANGSPWDSHTFTANLSSRLYWYYGFAKNVSVSCDGVSSNTVSW